MGIQIHIFFDEGDNEDFDDNEDFYEGDENPYPLMEQILAKANLQSPRGLKRKRDTAKIAKIKKTIALIRKFSNPKQYG